MSIDQHGHLRIHIFIGLDKDPKFLADSMSATTSPEKAAEASVLVSGGFDPCQYEVEIYWSVKWNQIKLLLKAILKWLLQRDCGVRDRVDGGDPFQCQQQRQLLGRHVHQAARQRLPLSDIHFTGEHGSNFIVKHIGHFVLILSTVRRGRRGNSLPPGTQRCSQHSKSNRIRWFVSRKLYLS